MNQKYITLHLENSCNLRVFSGHLLLSLFQHLEAQPPDPLPEFRTPFENPVYRPGNGKNVNI